MPYKAFPVSPAGRWAQWSEPASGRDLHRLKSSAFHGALLRQSFCHADCFFQCVLDFGSLIAKQHIPNSALPSEGVHSTRLLSVCHGVTALTCGTFADSSGAGTCTLGWYRRLWRGSDMETRSELCSGHNFGHNRPQSSALNVPRIMAK